MNEKNKIYRCHIFFVSCVCFVFLLGVPPLVFAKWPWEGNGSSVNEPSGGGAKPSQSKIMVTDHGSVPQYLYDEGDLGDDALEEKEEKKSAGYLGRWLRQVVYAGGQVVATEPAILELKKDFFISTGTCSVTGSLDVEGETIKMTTVSSSCFNHNPGAVTVSTFRISEDGQTMTMVNTQFGAAVEEVYKRQN